MRHFARAHIGYLPPGPWTEISATRFEAIKRSAKIPAGRENFHKNGVEVQVISETVSPEIYKNVYPELYQLLIEGSNASQN